ncbi:hypothetical protein [Sphingorhabdus sp.]|uniref:hypothetical protein n=1 Tax=Sphingorhabdus sp. TaxID=1902408 RepID=UPI00391BF249
MMKKRLSGHRVVLAIWLLLSAALIVSSWANIRDGVGWDPDDQLRLVQLRDFLNGQGWFDVRQYRLNPPDGAPMHWSRLIELPLAAITMLCTPLFGQAVAEIIASTIVPLLLFGAVIYLLAHAATQLGGRMAGTAAAVISAMSVPLLIQLRPMRIDHHGWQIAMAVLALVSLFYNNARTAGQILGAALAVWLHISLEGAPMSAAFFLFLGWRWLACPDETPRLFWTISAFTLSSCALFFGTQTQGLASSVYCDTVSPPQIGAILVAAAIMLPALKFAPRQAIVRALIMLTAAGAAMLAIVLRAPECANGAFGTLDPLVREYWYNYVDEGLPIWHQDPRLALICIVGPALGFVSSLYLARGATGEDRSNLIILGFFTFYALILSLLVFRTVSVASAYAVLPAALMIAHLLARYRQEGNASRRVLCVALILFLAVPNSLVSAFLDSWPDRQAAQTAQSEQNIAACESPQSVAKLGALPKGQFIAPFDMAPTILARTQHSVVASSHHRNERAMHDHIRVFISTPDSAHRLLQKRRVDYFALCVGEEELANYARKDPDGLWAQMAKGQVPAWLEPLPVMGKGIKVWRVR